MLTGLNVIASSCISKLIGQKFTSFLHCHFLSTPLFSLWLKTCRFYLAYTCKEVLSSKPAISKLQSVFHKQLTSNIYSPPFTNDWPAMLKLQSAFHKPLTGYIKATVCLSQATDWLHQIYRLPFTSHWLATSKLQSAFHKPLTGYIKATLSFICMHLTKLQSFTSNSDQPTIQSSFHSSMLRACVCLFFCLLTTLL